MRQQQDIPVGAEGTAMCRILSVAGAGTGGGRMWFGLGGAAADSAVQTGNLQSSCMNVVYLFQFYGIFHRFPDICAC
jgi:hypothetical protein